jgi:glycosyltransferase involved in cell wall biosynthesis
MKLLVVSFSCITPVNQGFFAAVEDQTGWDITIVSASTWKSDLSTIDELERWPEFEGRLIPVPVWLSGNIPLHVYRSTFFPIFRDVEPDVIYVHHEAYGLATAQVYFANWLWKQKPIGFYSCQNIVKRYPIPFRFFEQFVYRQSDFSFPITEAVLDVLRQKGYEGPADVLPLGIDTSLYHPKTPLPADELGAEPDEVTIGYVGRIVESKGLSTLLRALGRIPDLPWRLVMIGDGPYKDDFQRLAASLNIKDRISHLGYVPHPDVPRYLSSLDVLVLPSETQPNWKEQFGRVVIEAMACGTPVIGSDSGEIPNLIRTTGGGLVFPESDVSTLAAHLKTLILDPQERQRLATDGQQIASQQFALSSLANQFAETVSDVAERS